MALGIKIMDNQKKYINSVRAKKIEFKNGGELLKISINKPKFNIETQDDTNDAGWITLCVAKRKTVGKYGEVFSVYVDNFTPTKGE